MDSGKITTPPLVFGELVTRCGGNRSLARRMLSVFRLDVPVRISELSKAVESADAESICEAAHSIKGMTAMVSANGASELSAAIETSASATKLQEIPPLLQQLSDEVDRCVQYCKNEENRNGQ